MQLLGGARPELAANLNCIVNMLLSPFFGRPPTWEFASRFVASLAKHNQTAESSYVKDYILSGTGVELHSAIADLWYHWWSFGIGFAVIAALVISRPIRRPPGTITMRTVGSFAALSGLFYLCVGVLSDLRYLPLMIFIAWVTSQSGSLRGPR
jgi:hypothetical protein